MKKAVEENNLKLRSYSFYESLFKQEGWVFPIKHKAFGKNYITRSLREPPLRRGILII